MFIIIHDFKTHNNRMRMISCKVCKEIPIEAFDENTLSATVFTKVQPAVDYIDSLYENSKVTSEQRESMVDSLYDQLGNHLVGYPTNTWYIEK